MAESFPETVSSKEMAAIELNAEYLGVSRLQMMETAGHSVAYEVASRFKPEDGRVVVFAGVGGNGGDGLVAARHLSSLGFEVEVILVGKPDEMRMDVVRRNWGIVLSMADSVGKTVAYDSSLIQVVEANVLIDTMLGTGILGPLRPPILQAVRAFNRASGFKVAVDVPTGVNSDTGEVHNEAVMADLTITLHRPKTGLLSARKYVGELIVADIGMPKEAETYAGPGDVTLVRQHRSPESHKGDFGYLLVIGGSETFSGAPALVALAALRAGVDLVYIAAPEGTAHDISGMAPDLITVKLRGEHLNPQNVGTLKRVLERCDAVVMGPGLGLHKETVEAVGGLTELVEGVEKPLLLDADALKAFSNFKHRVDFPLVLTPHAGEYEILTGEGLPPQMMEKAQHVKRSANALNAVILLKGHIDIISDGVRIKFNATGNPGMTVGGTGDVLSGVVGAFLAQGFDPFRSAVAGAFINGASGDFAAREKGYHLIPSDLIDWIPRVIEDPSSHEEVRRPRL
ncbi:MAG: NAD(P)H-hydrate dehydratase [Candidatus Bathyarchaeia archaeon]